MFNVFTSYNFDREAHAYECDTREEAVGIMKDLFETEERESIYGIKNDLTSLDDIDGYAQIFWNDRNGEPDCDYMEIRIIETEKYKWRV